MRLIGPMRPMRLMRLMRLMRPMSLIGLIGLMSCLGLMGCSSDDDELTERSSYHTMAGVQGYVAGFTEAKKTNETYEPVTRGWLPPTDPISGKPYEFFENRNLPISVFFAREQEEDESDENYAENMQEEFFFKSGDKWRVSKDIESDTYYLYGYIPHDKSIESSVRKLEGEGKTYKDGAVLTLENIPTATSSDLCVVIGAKNGYGNGYTESGDYGITGLHRGAFEYVATGSDNNYVYLLFDHLYAAMCFRMTVQSDYAALRTIKVKDLSLQAYQGNTPTTKKMNAVITLNATAGADPISSIVFTPHGTEEAPCSFFSSESGYELGTNWSTFQAQFMPDRVTKLILISTYDVYDNKGNLIRKDCQATNTLNINLFDRQTETIRGTRYTINLTLNPTYLYVLSEPDLDNPTVTVE